MSLPNWPGAGHVYGRLMAVAGIIQMRAYAAQRAADKRKGFRFSPDPDGCAISKALGEGDEETLKALLWRHRDVKAA